MRGTGYAIGEILIFLAIATIIGFVLGWIVFHRRKPAAAEGSAATPKAVEIIEQKTKNLQSKLDYVEKRTNAVLGALERSPAVKERAESAAAEKASQAATAEGAQPERGATPERESAGAEDHQPEPVKKEALAPTEDEALDSYLSKADERIHQLEDTLDRLSEKLAELEE